MCTGKCLMRDGRQARAGLLTHSVLLGRYKFGLPYENTQRLRHTIAIGRIGSSAVRNMPLQDFLRGAIDRASRVVEEQLLLLRGHLPEEIARLLPVIILQAVVIVTSLAFERERQVSVFRLVVPQSLAIRVISRRRSQVSICPHLAIAVIG